VVTTEESCGNRIVLVLKAAQHLKRGEAVGGMLTQGVEQDDVVWLIAQ